MFEVLRYRPVNRQVLHYGGISKVPLHYQLSPHCKVCRNQLGLALLTRNKYSTAQKMSAPLINFSHTLEASKDTSEPLQTVTSHLLSLLYELPSLTMFPRTLFFIHPMRRRD